ncbi:FliM/FliN family flagellar motor switch protein [Aquibium sp. LZ166]|uniref:Flagellar motor switch protein FliM n=1 Tax=Aquibium pacificus TaxID=3153579 RepID=A0ABV3SCY1_9HYPH
MHGSVVHAGGRTALSIMERLVGATGEPEKVTKSGQILGDQLLKPMRVGLEDAANEAVPFELEKVEVDRIMEIVSASGPHDAVTLAASKVSPDALLIRIEEQAVAIIVNVLFGAEPETGAGRLGRDLSPVEVEVANLVCRLLAASFNSISPPAQQLKLPLPPVISGEVLRSTALRDGPAVRIDFVVGTEPETGRISLYIPQRVLLRRSKDETAEPETTDAQSSEWKDRFNEEVMRSRVKLEATMPVGKMSLGAISALRAGQVIELSRTAPTETLLSAKNKLLFVCEFGRLEQNYTVRIKGPVDSDKDAGGGLPLP